LQSISLSDILEYRREKSECHPKTLLYCTPETLIRDAMKTMSDNKILSMPVWDAESDGGEFVSFLSVIDVLRFCMRSDPNEDTKDTPKEVTAEDVLREISDEEETHAELWDESAKASELMEWFSLGIHRILVKDSKATRGTPQAFLLSQSDMVRYLAEHLQDSHLVMEHTVEECGFVNPRAPSIGISMISPIRTDLKAIHAFQKLYSLRTSALPIVDSHGKLMGSLSASDLRGITAEEVDRLLSFPVLEFLEARRSTRPFTCKSSTKLLEVVCTVSDNGVHRVWIVDDDDKPIGVVTMADILAKFSPFDYKLLHSDKI